jgi:8-oxo-dGTP pyrophosphatase MutT (NUDIX family)
MARNYEVFIDGKSLTFQTRGCEGSKKFESIHFDSFTNFISVENIFRPSSNCEIYCDNPKREFQKFKKHFQFLKAAGGIVEHEEQFLFIKRLGKWDLPKGKIEPNEKSKHAAIREIEEECNIFGLEVLDKICNTYHTYFICDKPYLKKSIWYHLKTESEDLSSLKPQLEEGITEIRWFSKEDFNEVRGNTFDSIQVVLDEFLKLRSLD